MEKKHSDIKRSMVKGAGWMVLFKAVNRGIGLISTMILARLLIPEDYGIVAMAMSFYAFIEILAAFGFDVVLIQKDDLEKSDYDSAWTLKLICYLIIAFVFFSSASAISEFYTEPKLVAVVHMLSLAMFLTAFENIAVVDFRRNLNFRREFNYQLVVKLFGFFVTVPLAFYLKSYWALIFGMVSSRLGNILVGYYLRPYMPKISFIKTRDIFSFSSWILFTNMLSFVEKKIPDFVLGRLFGSGVVGSFSLSSELSRYPATEIVAPINRAVYPGLNKLKGDSEQLRLSYLQLLEFICLVVLPLGLGFSLAAEPLVSVLLGDQWGAAVEPMRILSVAACFIAVSSSATYIYFILGRPKLSFFTALIKVLVLVPLVMYFSSRWGAKGAAYAYLISAVLLPIMHFYLTAKYLHIKYRMYVYFLARPIVASLIMFVMLSAPFFTHFISALNSDFLSLVIYLLSGSFIYFLSIFLLWVIMGRPDSVEKKIVLVILERLNF